MIVDNDLLSIQQARILAENAFAAQKKLAEFPQEKLDIIVESIANAMEKEAESLALLSHEETDCGNWQDKFTKNLFVCGRAFRNLKNLRCVGVLTEDRQNRTIDIGVPVGVILAMCPATSPVSTTIYKALIAIKSGNAIIFSPHPAARKVISKALDIMISTAKSVGLPDGCLAYLETVTKNGTHELMNHPAISMLLITGVPSMLKSAHASGKPVIYGGTGNGPAFIERSADIRQAVADIIRSKTFDNGIAPSAEQSIVVDACIATLVRQALQEAGGYFMSEDESLRLAAILFCPDGKRKMNSVGISALDLARRAGFNVPESTRVLLAERKYVSENDPYSRELLVPVLAYYIEDDWMDACEKCIELLLHERNAHTLVIHSNNADVIMQFALKKPVGRLLVNTPAAFGGMGATTNLFSSLIQGSGSAGRGITSDNVSPLNLIYVRKVGYGVRQMEEDIYDHGVMKNKSSCLGVCPSPGEAESQKIKLLQDILQEAIRVVSGSGPRT